MQFWQVFGIMVCLSLLVGLTGCGAGGTDPGSGNGGSPPESTETAVPYKQESFDQLPAEVRKKAEAIASKPEGDNAAVDYSGKTYVILSLGHRPTGGTVVRVNQVIQKGNTVTISAEEVPPPEDAVTTQAITPAVTVISLRPKGEVKFDYRVRSQSVNPPADGNRLPHREEERREWPAAVRKKAETLQQRPDGGEATVEEGNRIYCIIALGQRPTGGYQIRVDRVTEQTGEIHIHAREIPPPSDAKVTQSVSQPLRVISIDRPDGDRTYRFHVAKRPDSGEDAR